MIDFRRSSGLHAWHTFDLVEDPLWDIAIVRGEINSHASHGHDLSCWRIIAALLLHKIPPISVPTTQFVIT